MKQADNIKYIEYYIKELENRHGDPEKIKEMKDLLKRYREQGNQIYYGTTDTKNFAKTKNKKRIKKTSTKKQKVKGINIKKQLAIGLGIGFLLGVPAYNISYNYVINLPSSHNYKTVREERKNLEHDDTNYRKYLKNKGLSEKEIEERIKEEETNNRWNRDDEDER